jgi:hypothetical protein
MEGNKKQKIIILLQVYDWTSEADNSSVPLPKYDELVCLHDESLINELIDTDRLMAVKPETGEVVVLWAGVELCLRVISILNDI